MKTPPKFTALAAAGLLLLAITPAHSAVVFSDTFDSATGRI